MVDHASNPHRRDRSRQGAGDGEVPGGDRVAKALARAGVASRREVERLIEAGRVALNGRVLATPAVKVGPGDILTVDGVPVSDAEPTRVWRYHKPVGLVTTHNDPQGRPTVFAALPPGLPRVISVGRLDLNSEGLLLLTNDGALARALELPSSGWVRRYRARARGRADQARLDRLQDGVTVDGVRYGPVEAVIDKVKAREGGAPANIWITVALTEGKNREVRKVLESVGLKVNRLIRLSYGPFALGTLAAGEVEEIGPRVLREQLKGFIAPENMPLGDRAAGPVLAARPSRRGPPPEPAPPRRPEGAAPRPRPPFKGPARKGQKPILPTDAPRPAAAAAEGKVKAYKPGWAKPKPKAGHGPRPAGKGRGPRRRDA